MHSALLRAFRVILIVFVVLCISGWFMGGRAFDLFMESFKDPFKDKSPHITFYTRTLVEGTPVHNEKVALNLTDILGACDPPSPWIFELSTQYSSHAIPTQNVKLYHGTTVGHAKSILASGGPRIMHPKWKHENESAGALSPIGGFYMSDSPRTAVQYARQVWGPERKIAVLQFDWHPAGMRVFEFNEDTDEARDFYNDFVTYNLDNNRPSPLSTENDMLAGPMLAIEGVHVGTWEYVVVTSKGLEGLSFSGILTDVCDVLPQLEPGFEDR